MQILVNQGIVVLSGSLTYNCWETLKSKCLRVLQAKGSVTIYCDGLTMFTADGLQTLVSAYDFALNSRYVVGIVGLDAETEDRVLALLQESAGAVGSSLPRAG